MTKQIENETRTIKQESSNLVDKLQTQIKTLEAEKKEFARLYTDKNRTVHKFVTENVTLRSRINSYEREFRGETKEIDSFKVQKALRKYNKKSYEIDVINGAEEIIKSNIFKVDENGKITYKLNQRQLCKFIKITANAFCSDDAVITKGKVVWILGDYIPNLDWKSLKKSVLDVKKVVKRQLKHDFFCRSKICSELVGKLNKFYENSLNTLPINNLTSTYQQGDSPSHLEVANTIKQYCNTLDDSLEYYSTKIMESNSVSKENNEYKLDLYQIKSLVKTIKKNYNYSKSVDVLVDGVSNILEGMPKKRIEEKEFKEVITFLKKGYFTRVLQRKKRFEPVYNKLTKLLMVTYHS